MVFGLDESDLRDDVKARHGAGGRLTVQPDPEPLRNRFIRSDQYSFIRAGIPSLAMKVGYDAGHAGGGDRGEVDRRALPRAVGRPQPADQSVGGREVHVEVVRDLAVRIANRADRPRWNDASFFKRFANGATH